MPVPAIAQALPFILQGTQQASAAGGNAAMGQQGGGINAGAIGFGGGALAGLFGGLGANRSARKAQARREEYGNSILNNLVNIQQAYGLQSEGKLLEALGAIKGGVANQLKETDKIGQSARRRTLDREQQGYGAITQGLTNAGLSSTTRTANLSRGVRSDTDRALLAIDDALAQLRTGIIGQGAAAEASGLGNIAQLYQNRSQQRGAIENTRYNLFTGGNVAPSQVGDLSGIGPLLAILLGGKQGASDYRNLFAG